jgi:hypothetical protein
MVRHTLSCIVSALFSTPLCDAPVPLGEAVSQTCPDRSFAIGSSGETRAQWFLELTVDRT